MICQGLVSMCKFNNSSEETWGETLSVLFIHKASAGQTKNRIYQYLHRATWSAVICHPMFWVQWRRPTKGWMKNNVNQKLLLSFFSYILYYDNVLIYKTYFVLIFKLFVSYFFSINFWIFNSNKKVTTLNFSWIQTLYWFVHFNICYDKKVDKVNTIYWQSTQI